MAHREERIEALRRDKAEEEQQALQQQQSNKELALAQIESISAGFHATLTGYLSAQ